MDVRRRPVGSVEAKPNGKPLVEVDVDVHDPIKASDALPLPLYLANAVFFGVFFSVVYFLLTRWREKIRTSTPLHVVTLSEIAAIVTFMGSCIYLLGFFGIDFVQGFIARPGHDNEWDAEDDIIVKEDARAVPCGAAIDCAPPVVAVASPKPKVPVSPPSSEEDEEIIKSVVAGAIPSYSLESRLGDCRRAAAIRREALQRMTGTSLEGLPLEGLDYESILGQCCEMPVGYIQIPVGIAGPLLLDGREYSIPMATTEGCLVASTNRGCKAIYASGGATSVLLRDAMTRAPVVRFGTAKRAAELMLFLENPLNFETLALVFNRYCTPFFSFSEELKPQNPKCCLWYLTLLFDFWLQVQQIREAPEHQMRNCREEPVHQILKQHWRCNGDEHDLQRRPECFGFPSE